MKCIRRLPAALVLGSLATAAQAQAATPFDGSWQTVISCIGAQDGAAGYTLRFTSSVKDGLFHGEHGVHGTAGSLSVDGQIMADGSALLLATGLTNDPAYNFGHVGPMRPVLYHIQSHFEASHGSGTRLELRHCDAVFGRP